MQASDKESNEFPYNPSASIHPSSNSWSLLAAGFVADL
jgi:hypothetical protein